MEKTVSKSMKNKMKVLVVEDCPVLRDLVAQNIGDCIECSIDQAEDGSEALKMLSEGSYDLCFTDHRMPLKTGKELILEAHLKGIKTPFIMFTGTPPKIKSPNLREVVCKPNIDGLKQSALRFTEDVA